MATNNTLLKGTDILPLTCTRKGTCCHGNQVLLNPWELNRLANEKGIDPSVFRERYCDLGGIRLRFDGKTDHRGKHACSQYTEHFGCSVHAERPLACRLFPLGRMIQEGEVQYMHQGAAFPCLNGCPEVLELPSLSVGDYLQEQGVDAYAVAQDEYLELMQNLADNAFALLLDTGLAETGETETLAAWRRLGAVSTDELAKELPSEWIELLLFPNLNVHQADPLEFVRAHNEHIQERSQATFEHLNTLESIRAASVLMMTMALYLATALGGDKKELMDHWIAIAVSNGASE